jgi:peptide/nickel transport system substrate-binding protein
MNEFEHKLKAAEKLAARSQVSRRDFMQLAAITGLTVPAANALFTQSAYADEPKKGGNFIIGMEGGSASDSLDPSTYADSVMIAASLAVCNNLVEFDDKGNPTGELFESWEAKPGAVEWTFKVRQGIKFSNGKTLDADDILYSIGIHRTEDTKSPAKSILEPIKEIKATSPSEVVITLKSGNADFPYLLGDYHVIIVPKDFKDWSHLIGTGAYTLESFEPGVRLTFKNRGDYWKPGRGNFDTVEIRNIQDAAARTAALQSGEIHAANRMDPRTVDLLMKDPNLTITRTKGTGFRYCFVAQVTADPFTNKDLRLAMKYGMDRESIVKQVFGGYAALGNDHTIDALNPYYNTNLAQRAYDPDKAAFHFKKAGLAAGTKIELQTSEGAWSSAVDCAQIYQESLKKAGVELTVNKVSADGYWDNVWPHVPFCAVYWGRRMSADASLTQVYGADEKGQPATWNDSKWVNADFQKLITDARVELDDVKRKEMYFKAQELISDDGGMICFAIGDYLDGYAKNVMGNGPHSRYDLGDDRIAEKAWFA